jgi:hypothetical protein
LRDFAEEEWSVQIKISANTQIVILQYQTSSSTSHPNREETIREWKGLRHSVPALPVLLLLSLSHAPLTQLLAGRVSDIKTNEMIRTRTAPPSNNAQEESEGLRGISRVSQLKVELPLCPQTPFLSIQQPF